MMQALPKLASDNGIDLPTWIALKYSVYPGVEDESILKAFLYCKSRNLDPIKKPVHVVQLTCSVIDKNGSYVLDQNRRRVQAQQDVILPGINEYRMTASATGQMAGVDEPQFGPIVSIYGHEVPEWCKVTVYRMVGNLRAPFTHIEYFTEACGTYFDIKKQETFLRAIWARRPRGQLAKCAEAGALRKAFPGEVGAVVTADEINDDIRADMPEYIEVSQPSPAGEHHPKADSQTLNEESLAVVLAALKDAKLAEATICEAYQIDEISALPQNLFITVLNRIEVYKKRRLMMEAESVAQPAGHSAEQESPLSMPDDCLQPEGDVPPIGEKRSVQVLDNDDDDVVFQ